jgi:hypothetical protein
MSFVFPSFLWALVVLAIPVIVHLFNFRKTQRIYFSSNRFLRQVQEATSAKRRLKHYLILASRLLFLFFLVLAFAQPFLPAREQRSATREVILYLDNSMSMSAPVGEKIRAWDVALQQARKVTDAFPADTRYKLITNDFAPFSNGFKSKGEMQDLLSQQRLSPVSRGFKEIMDRVRSDGTPLSQEMFWISDFQKSTLGRMDSAPTDSLLQLRIVPLTLQSQTNVFVDTAYLANPFVVGGERNTLDVQLRNEGNTAVDQLVVKLTLNGIQTGSSTVSLPARGVAHTTFDLTTGLQRFSKAVISFSDYPVSFDNEFYLALNFAERIRILEIKPDDRRTPVETVFGNTLVFNFSSHRAGNLNYSLLKETDLLVLSGLPTADAALTQAVVRYKAEGGTVLIIPPAQPDLVFYKSLLRMPALQSLPSQPLAELQPPDFSNPFFEHVVEATPNRLAMPKVSRVVEWGPDRSALLKLKTGEPVLSVWKSDGITYLLAAPVDERYTDLASHFLFLPVMYRIASSAKRVETKPYHVLTEPVITLRTDSITGELPIRLLGPQEVIPSQRKTSSQVVMELPRFTLQAGFYYALHRQDTLGLFAFNMAGSESFLAQYTGSEVLNQLQGFEKATLFEANSAEAFSNEIKERYLGKPLWKHALILALIFLLAEILLIRFLK